MTLQTPTVKVPLKPGRSLMDWIRLTKSGKDLTGLKGRLIEVTEEELAKHNKTDDCWICIRGLVYNVTPYMEYHPGGEGELMKAAGADGTDLFDQVHRWVNYESMLKECLVGRMALKPIALPKESTSALSEEKKCLNGMLPESKIVGTSKSFAPSYDWFQTDCSVTVVVYTKQKGMNSEMVILDYEDSRLRGEIIIRDYSYLLNIELSNAVQEDIAVHVAEKVGKVEIVLKKKDNIPWKKLGQPLESHNSFIKRTDQGLYYRKCKLISKTEVTHDTRLFCLLLPQSTHFQVPVGQHVYLKQIVTGKEVVKPYTPVSCSLQTHFKEPSCHDGACLFLMIKIYPSGLFSSELDRLQIGDYIYVSNPEGSFQKCQVQTLEDLFLLAAGTGFTPMIKLLNYVLTNVNSLWTVKLMFFNKTEDDILWRDQLEQLILQDKRFEAQFILSEPSKEWNGKRGKISSSLLSEFFKRSKQDSKVLICICGPAPFTEQGERFLKDLGYCKEEIHSFTA
ncbi:cytochrome b5 reductase 4 isoform X1 [Alligator sinensis]|uniref:Cytochrome b5 reductase 4 n=2 Tax=Alligator sinensis TaxID=38654 RepID=A0A3Q0HHE4_ALLSI|nr:cytochrome b5 reductase 4 isoform X1 [Alligator sinensis]XP_025071093.1 cytochrome b5 reductase 4 isoform X1 [Alligator sinensis]